jgi:type IV secretory pathway TrbF-like protein
MDKQEEWEKEFDKMMSEMPQRVSATPRIVLKSFIRNLRSKDRDTLIEKDKWMNAHAQYVADTLDGMKPEKAYEKLNKILSNK